MADFGGIVSARLLCPASTVNPPGHIGHTSLATFSSAGFAAIAIDCRWRDGTNFAKTTPHIQATLANDSSHFSKQISVVLGSWSNQITNMTIPQEPSTPAQRVLAITLNWRQPEITLACVQALQKWRTQVWIF
ncbi:MAG: hypothetical protein M5U34_28765 [Chloroflexi bacterium]|nr:hypothetical protein [Chloroflexota bacterium]